MADVNEVHEMFFSLKEIMGAEMLLDELYRATDSDEMYENLRWIIKMNDIEL